MLPRGDVGETTRARGTVSCHEKTSGPNVSVDWPFKGFRREFRQNGIAEAPTRAQRGWRTALFTPEDH
jgi:hypothetical protein